jgi:hypothetical protein
MKSKKALLASIAVLIASGVLWQLSKTSPVDRALKIEWIENTFPEKPDEESIIPFGYTLGSWPKTFLGDPIVTRLTYQKGPPTQFIQTLVQIWKPVEVELTLNGPRTLKPGFGADQWKTCFQSSYLCSDEKREIWKWLKVETKEESESTLTWFDSMDPLGPRGLHLNLRARSHQLDRYAIITPQGAIQVFSLKSALNPNGMEGKDLFLKTLSGLKVKDDLSSARAWIQTKIKGVSLDQARAIPDPKLRYQRLIQIQNWLFSLLSVDPTRVEPFFHLAGTTHVLAMDLMKTKEKVFENQESWILNFKPLLMTLIAYAKDFKDGGPAVQNMEALLQDILVEEKRISR